MNQVNQMSTIKSVASSSEIPGDVITRMRIVQLRADEDAHVIYAKDISIDEHFLDVYDIKLLYGRDFGEVNIDNGFMLNESAAKDLFGNDDLETKINQTFYYLNTPHQLIGITADYSQESLKVSTEPHIYSAKGRVRFYSVKMQGGDVSGILADVEDAFVTSFPASHFDYFFLDDHFNRQYKSDRLFGNIFTFFSILAVVITSLGLFGLSLFNVSQRGKEISIRKVLGASIKSISLLLSREYFVLLIIASTIALPLGYFMIDQWLSNFAYRMSIGVVIFMIPVLSIVIITFISVAYQIVKASFQNPSNSLRQE